MPAFAFVGMFVIAFALGVYVGTYMVISSEYGSINYQIHMKRKNNIKREKLAQLNNFSDALESLDQTIESGLLQRIMNVYRETHDFQPLPSNSSISEPNYEAHSLGEDMAEPEVVEAEGFITEERLDHYKSKQKLDWSDTYTVDPKVVLERNSKQELELLENEMFHDIEEWKRIPEKYRITPETRGKFFLYQPSGGWGNQRLILRWAMLAANAMNRTLVLPPVAPHSNFYYSFNEFGKSSLLHMGQVLDLSVLETRVTGGILVHDGDMESYQNGIFRNLTWRTWSKPKEINYFTEKHIHSVWHDEPADVVFWHKTSMWQCCTTNQVHYYTFLNYGTQFAPFLHSLALRLAKEFGGPYNAIHFRRGDSQHYKDRKSVEKYVNFHAFRMHNFNKSIPLYIATDETQVEIFDKFVSKFQYTKILSAKDLNPSLLKPLLDNIPKRMQGDMIGFIEQLICLYSQKWSGSYRSTFSYVISSMRNHRRRRGKFFSRASHVRFLPRLFK